MLLRIQQKINAFRICDQSVLFRQKHNEIISIGYVEASKGHHIKQNKLDSETNFGTCPNIFTLHRYCEVRITCSSRQVERE